MSEKIRSTLRLAASIFLLTNPVGVNLFGYFNVHSMRATADVINDMISGDAASRDSETGFDLGGQDHPVILAA